MPIDNDFACDLGHLPIIICNPFISTSDTFSFNPFTCSFFWGGNKDIYLYFMLLHQVDMAQVVQILPQIGQQRAYST